MQMSSFNFAANIRSFAVPALLLLSAQAAAAGDPITITSTIPYANDKVGTVAVRQECDWNTVLPAVLVAQSKGNIVATDTDLSTVTGRKLTMTVVNVHAAGGMFGGPKWAIVRGELSADGELQGNFEFRRVSNARRFTSCSSLDRIARALAVSITEWLKHPTLSAAPGAEAEAIPAG